MPGQERDKEDKRDTRNTRDTVFVSYSHKDGKWINEVKTMLSPLIRQGKITYWDDTDIKAGEKWDSEIQAALDTAKIALLLVSDSFLASDYIMNKELPAIMEAAARGECRVCWLLLSECLVEETGLQEIQALHDIKKPLAGLSPAKRKKILAEAARQIRDFYKQELPPPPKKPKQIKILSIMASPEDISSINYEQEQDLMLEVFRGYERDEVFLDMPDPVNSSLAEIESHLEDGRHDILHITAHGGISDSGEGYLCLEDRDGKNVEVSGALLVKSLVPLPRVVILSACHSAQAEPGLMPAAQAIFKAGIDVVIGMNKAVSHYAAMEFNAAFFKALCRGRTVSDAFKEGKDAILAGEQQRLRDMPDWNFLNEADIPQLLVRDKDAGLTREDFSDHIIAAPGRPQSHQFMGARYLERGFIGRRKVLRDIHQRIREREGAVVLKGPGGIGKSTLTTRMAANLRVNGYEFIVIRGETSPELILDAISKHATLAGIEGSEQVYAAQAEPEAKLAWFLENFLLKRNVLVIFDNFEENQEEKSGEFLSERLQKFLDYFRDAMKHKDSFLFFSTRYRLPGYAEYGMTLDIPELSDVEFRKLLQNSAALKRLDSKSVENLRREVGGNPRGLELLDKIAFEEFHRREFSWEQLKGLIPELQRRIIEKPESGDDFTPLYLGRLLGYLSESQAKVLEILAIYRVAVPEAAIAVHGAQGASMARLDRLKLSALSLLECRETDEERLYYVHRLTAQYLLGKMEKAAALKYHLQAAHYFVNLKNEKGESYLFDLIETRWHFIQAGEWNRAAEITFTLEKYLTLHGYPFRSMELLQELDIEKLDEKHLLVTYGQMGSLYQDFGEYDTSIEFHKKASELAQQTNDLQNSANALHQIGIIYYLKGEYEEALKHYRQALEIAEKISDIKGISESLHQIGLIYQEKGEYEEALKHYRQAKDLSEKIGDNKNVASSIAQIGIIYYLKGNFDEALQFDRQALAIREKIGDINGIAICLHQIGWIYQIRGDVEEALKHYRQSLEIAEKIGDIPGVAKSLHQIGMVYQKKGDYEEALKHYRQSLEMAEKIGDMLGLALSLSQMGTLYAAKNEFATALRFFIQAFLIFDKIGSPNAEKAAQGIALTREKLPPEEFKGILKEYNVKFIAKEENLPET